MTARHIQTHDTNLIPAWIDGALTPVDKMEVHRLGLRHKAVSIFVVDGRDVLIQQRALGKYHTPGLWANTCCTHPYWGEASSTCARRRLGQELGIDGLHPILTEHVTYRADVGGGMVEHEEVDLFIAYADKARLVIDLDPAEVMATRWIDLYDLAAEVARSPEKFTPWLRIYLDSEKTAIFSMLASH